MSPIKLSPQYFKKKPLVIAVAAVISVFLVEPVSAFKPAKAGHGHTYITSSVLGQSTSPTEGYKGFLYHGKPSGGVIFQAAFSGGVVGVFSEEASQAITIGNQSTDYVSNSKNILGTAKEGDYEKGERDAFIDDANSWVLEKGGKIPLDSTLWHPDDVNGKGELNDPRAHCDDDFIVECSNRIKELRDMAVNNLKKSVTATNLTDLKKFQVMAWLQLGKALHTLQDFYAHSNFSDSQENDTAYFAELTRNPETLSNVTLLADKVMSHKGGRQAVICKPRSGSVFGSWDNNGGNWNIQEKAIFSTGWFSLSAFKDFVAASDEEGNSRCDHSIAFPSLGLLTDPVSGIAKDDPFAPFTDHSPDTSTVSELHKRASSQAATHTKVFLEETIALIKIKEPDADKQDAMIAALLGQAVPVKNPIPESEVKGDKPIYGFVIDTTGSMRNVIEGVRRSVDEKLVEALGKQPNQQFMLVTFDDAAEYDISSQLGISEPVFGKANFIKNQVANLYVGGGGGCPENAYRATLKAVNVAPKDSTLYVFTDASPNDESYKDQVIAQANKKGITLDWVISGTCGSSSRLATSRRKTVDGQTDTRFFTKPIKAAKNVRALAAPSYTVDQTYLDIAAATGGQVIQTEHNAESVSAALAGIDLSIELVDVKTIRSEQGAITTPKTIEFKLDDEATVLSVVATLDKGDISFISPSGVVVAGDKFKLLSFLGGTTLKAIDPSAGLWKVVFTPTADGTANYTLRAAANARADLKSIRFTGVSEIGRAGHSYYPDFGLSPVVGKNRVEAVLSGINATDLKLKAVNDVGIVLAESALKSMGGEYYETEITLPNSKFQLVIDGKNSATTAVAFERAFSTPLSTDSLLVGMVRSEPMLAGRKNLVSYRITNLGAKESFTLSTATDTGVAVELSATNITLDTKESKIITFAVQLSPANVVGKETLNTTFEVKGSVSEDSDISTFNISHDSDNDGVPDSVEMGESGSDDKYDGNGDGTPDWQQNTVTSLHSQQLNGYVTLSMRGSGVFASMKSQPTLATEKLTLPLDAFEMVITGVDATAKTDVEIKLPEYMLAKHLYHNINDEWVNFTLLNGVGLKSAVANVLVVTLADGEIGDLDVLKNGEIHFYGAPAELHFKGVAEAEAATTAQQQLEEDKKEPWYKGSLDFSIVFGLLIVGVIRTLTKSRLKK